MPAVMDAARPAGGAAPEDGHFDPAILDFDEIERRVEKSLVRKVHKLIDDFPERAIEVIRGWLAEGG
ncbi:MAG: hypothetical protein ACE5GT_00475 [Rhodospirillales bacterium]